jgi:hypothetical protein
MTTGLTFGPLDQNGRMKVTLVYDHRLMDGSFIADRLLDLETQLTGAVLTELQDLSRQERGLNSSRETCFDGHAA